MRVSDIIQKKVQKKTFTEAEINFIIKGIVKKEIPDYLITAWLMAIYINGLNINEAYYLTKAMWENSIHIDLTNEKIHIDIVDKHSTGGIGDKVSLILLPIIASGNLPVAKISGRGLGFTGGTIDKIESVGATTNLSKKQMFQQLIKNKIFISSQTDDLVPADKILYSLRSATNTINNYGLIASSILSKKFSILGTHVFIDVKYGTGAFCSTYLEAKKLIKYLKAIAIKMNRKLTICVSNMDQPLGRDIGNAIEIMETIQFLSGDPKCSHDLKELIYKLATVIFCSYDKSLSKNKAIAKINRLISSKTALNKFYEWMGAQGANINNIKKGNFWNPKFKYDVFANENGYLTFISNSSVGIICNQLGAGRVLKTDKIDFHAGMHWHHKWGDKIKKGDCVVTCYSSKPINKKNVYESVMNCINIKKTKPHKLYVVRKIITNEAR